MAEIRSLSWMLKTWNCRWGSEGSRSCLGAHHRALDTVWDNTCSLTISTSCLWVSAYTVLPKCGPTQSPLLQGPFFTCRCPPHMGRT